MTSRREEEVGPNSKLPDSDYLNSKIRELKANIPKLRLPASFTTNILHERRKDITNTTSEEHQSQTEENENDSLKRQISELQKQNDLLKFQNEEVTGKLEIMTKEIRHLRDENQTLILINEGFGQENDQLCAELNRYRSRCNVQLNNTDLTVNDPGLQADVESDGCVTRPAKRHKNGKKPVHHTGDDKKLDLEGARSEMKLILKTLPSEFNLKYEETFTSEANTEIRQKLIPELLKSMKPRYNPTYEQLKSWLQALHRHRRIRYIYRKKGKIDKDNQRLHNNNRLNKKKIRRIKSAKSLFAKKDERLSDYTQENILSILQDNRYHSPELSETDDKNPNEKRRINIYDLSWRSDELKHLLREILDSHSLSLQTSKLTRYRYHNDDLYYYKLPHPPNAPDWTYNDQNASTDFDKDA